VKTILIILFFVLPSTVPVVASAQNSLILPRSVRAMGMGETGVADASDPANMFYNPALAAWTKGACLSALYTRPFESVSPEVLNYGLMFGAGRRWDAGVMGTLSFGCGLSANRVDYGEIRLYDSSGRKLATDFSFEHTWGLTLGMMVGDDLNNVGLGLAVKPWMADYGFGLEVSETYFDAGIRLQCGVGDPGQMKMTAAFALSSLNIGKSEVALTSFDWTGSQRYFLKVPTYGRMGLSLRVEGPPSKSIAHRYGRPVPSMAMIFNLDSEKNPNSDIPDLYTVGAEFALHGVLFARIGQSQFVNCTCMTAGIGVGIIGDKFSGRVDLARLPFWGEPERAFDSVKTENKVGISIAYRY